MIVIPNDFWDGLGEAFAACPEDHEQVAYLDGVRHEGGAVVTTLTVPEASTEPFRYHVDADGMSRAGQHFRRFDLVRIAQVHTHPGGSVDHSPWDDTKTYSQRHGAVSIVLPHYGRERLPPNSPQVGVHLRTEAGWTRLSPSDVTQLIRIVPSAIDNRNPPCQPESLTATDEPPLGLWSSIRHALRRFGLS